VPTPPASLPHADRPLWHGPRCGTIMVVIQTFAAERLPSRGNYFDSSWNPAPNRTPGVPTPRQRFRLPTPQVLPVRPPQISRHTSFLLSPSLHGSASKTTQCSPFLPPPAAPRHTNAIQSP
jgi:hypothetical protein